MKTQQPFLAGMIELDRGGEYAQQKPVAKEAYLQKEAYSQNCANPRRSPLPSAGDIDRALERRYGAARYGQI